LRARFQSGEIGFYDLPVSDSLAQAQASQRLAEAFRSRPELTDCLFLGIGGSALGPISLLEALSDQAPGKMRFHFQENVDPIAWKRALAKLSPEKTLVCCVTKSGTTFETIAQFLVALEWLGKERWKTQIVAITDPVKGDLRRFVELHGIPSLELAPSVGGRFSVFTPVGLFAAALAGLQVDALLAGAKSVRDAMERLPAEKNPLFLVAEELIHQAPHRPVHVCMPYCSPLKQLGAWFVQLWGESLGKDGKGFTPLAALGATDQHSILQLLRDGPDDKVTWFIGVDEVTDPVSIPRAISGIETTQLPSFAQLQGHSLQALLQTELQATALVLSRQGRPHLTFRLDRLDERSLGALYFAFAVLTAVTGTLWGVNPFDQPGVEEGKVYIREALAQRRAQALEAEDPNSPVARLRR
jgi:glucose-6-phosphate isomerase